MAALADIVPSIQKPWEYYSSNVLGTYNVVECAREADIKKLVYAASSSCYGIPDSYPTDEKADIRPQYPYALTKRLGEETVLHWGQVYNLPVITLRLFNVYGTRSRTSRNLRRRIRRISGAETGRQAIYRRRNRRADAGFHLCDRCSGRLLYRGNV